MAWSERQQAMLRAMGLRVWGPAAPDLTDATDAVPGAAAGEPVIAAPAPPAASAAPAPRPVPRPGSDGEPAPAVSGPPAGAEALAPDERTARIARMDWPALREAVAACRACDLCDGRRQTVFGVGGAQARWMVVGEAPGEHEDRQGEPFVGAAGQLLDRMLAALGLTREADGVDPAQQVYIANTLKCRPPGNRNPAPAELAACEPFLVRQIELVRPQIILAMGRFAVQSLLRSHEPIGKLRGRVHTFQGVPLVVTYHPAYLLRNLPDKARAWQDLCLAAATAESARGA